MLRLLETQASNRITAQNSQKAKKLTTVILSKLRVVTVTLDMICSQPSYPICRCGAGSTERPSPSNLLPLLPLPLFLLQRGLRSAADRTFVVVREGSCAVALVVVV